MDFLSGVVIYTCDPSTKDAETSLDYRVRGLPKLHSKTLLQETNHELM